MDSQSRAQLDIVVPARNEARNIVECLEALPAAGPQMDLRVIVVANGEDWETTSTAASHASAIFESQGMELKVFGHATPGKTRALNLGDRHTRGCPVAYLDADVRLAPGALHHIGAALDCSEPRLAGPHRVLRQPLGVIARNYARVWRNLPAVKGRLIGTGCYAVNPAGRARWGEFPPIIADDAFVQSRFCSDEWTICTNAPCAVTFPEWPELIVAIRRWRAGSEELRHLPAHGTAIGSSDPRAGWPANLRFIWSHPDLWRSVPAYLFVQAISRMGPPPGMAWTPHRAEGFGKAP